MKFRKILSLFIVFLGIGLVFYNYYPENKLPENTQIDKLVVYKSKRQLLAYSNGKLIKTYQVSLGGNPIGDKEIEGDKKTPEGQYFINEKNPNGDYHKYLGISYPSDADIEHANLMGKSPGGEIEIHGLKNNMGFLGKLHRLSDWTLGCIALTNPEIDELYNAVKIGTPIDIKP